MQVDVLVAEIGSTTTLVNVFTNIDSSKPVLLGQGTAPTSIEQGDVRIGLDLAIKDFAEKINCKPAEITWNSFLATSSAAGGLRMTVHGLVYDMTVKAAKEAALGAGANVHQISAGIMRQSDIDQMIAIKPNIIMIAGGVDYGERKTAILNAEAIHHALIMSKLKIPVIYAGNIENQDELGEIFADYRGRFAAVENVYPRIDELNIIPARRIIQEIFEQHITHAPGMEHIREMVNGPIAPTPGAVMLAAQLLKEDLGDLMVIDVGGATTDIHSVTSGSAEIGRILMSPEPYTKRTVEGDLGIYINRHNIMKIMLQTQNNISLDLEKFNHEIAHAVDNLGPVPTSETDKNMAVELTRTAVNTALSRHAGNFRDLYGPQGKTRMAEGKDLTAVKYCIGTGGALTRLPDGKGIMRNMLSDLLGKKLYPGKDAKFLIDQNYIMASLGVLSIRFPEAARKLIKESLGLGAL